MEVTESPTDDTSDPELPQLPPVNPTPQNPRYAHILSTAAPMLGTSSDPPVFSSDDLAPSAENYSIKRKKFRRVGPWWQSGVPDNASHPRKKRRIDRNVDSGVFLASETSLASSDVPSSDVGNLECPDRGIDGVKSTTAVPAHPHFQSNPAHVGETEGLLCIDHAPIATTDGASLLDSLSSRGHATLVPQRMKLARLPDPAAAHAKRVADIIEAAVEAGVEDIMLDEELQWLDGGDAAQIDHVLRPLHYLVKTRRFDDASRYEELVPNLRLFLNSNYLVSLPREVYRLENLTSLSLRNNRLQTLEHFIGHLPRLSRINLCANEIRWLPEDFLRTTFSQRDGELSLDDNYFTRIIVPSDDNSSLESKLKSLQVQTSLRAMSQICWKDAWGNPVEGSAPDPSRTKRYVPRRQSFEPSAVVNRTKSLTELCAAKVSVEAPRNAPVVLDSLPASQHLIDVVKLGWDIQECGFQNCYCGSHYVIPRAEWFEWLATVQRGRKVLIPYLVRTCSWTCALERKAVWASIIAGDQKRHDDGKERDTNLSDEPDQPDVTYIRFNCGWSWQG